MYGNASVATSDSSIGAQFCDNSCLGRNDTFKGINNFGCSGSEDTLANCSNPAPRLLSGICGETIGVICCKLYYFNLEYAGVIPYVVTLELTTCQSEMHQYNIK